MQLLVYILMFVWMLFPASVNAKPLFSGEFEFGSANIYPESFNLGKAEVLKAFISYGDKCSVDVFGAKDLHPSGAGDEVTFGAMCRFQLSKTLKASLRVDRASYRTADGLTEFALRLERGRWDTLVSYFQWDGTNPDGFSAQVGYTYPVTPSVGLRTSAIYTTGFRDPTVGVAGFDLRWRFAKSVSLGVVAYVPTVGKPWTVMSLRYSF